MQSHRAAKSGFDDSRRVIFLVDRPHAFEIVETAHLGPEQMDDDIACIDQYPVGIGKTFDSGDSAGLFGMETTSCA